MPYNGPLTPNPRGQRPRAPPTGDVPQGRRWLKGLHAHIHMCSLCQLDLPGSTPRSFHTDGRLSHSSEHAATPEGGCGHTFHRMQVSLFAPRRRAGDEPHVDPQTTARMRRVIRPLAEPSPQHRHPPATEDAGAPVPEHLPILRQINLQHWGCITSPVLAALWYSPGLQHVPTLGPTAGH